MERTPAARSPREGRTASVMAPDTAPDGMDTETDDPIYAGAREDIASLRRQVHGLRSKLHGELALLALRIEDNERRAMKRRKVMRRWGMAAVVAMWLWLGPSAVRGLLNGPFLLPGILLVGMTLVGGITLVVLILHNDADEQDHGDRHHNWFRLTARDDLPRT
jgi:hypothetical protein